MTDEKEIEVEIWEGEEDHAPLDSATLPISDAQVMVGNAMHDLEEGEENLVRVKRLKTDDERD